MKAQMKAIAASAIVVALCLCAVGGVTYSWFSDEAETNINVTTGVINVESTIDDLQLYTFDGVADKKVANNDFFKLGGAVNLDSSNNMISVEKMVAGDGFTFKLDYEIESDIAYMWRVNVVAADGFEILTSNNSPTVDNNNALQLTGWKSIDSDYSEVKSTSTTGTMYVYIGMPTSATYIKDSTMSIKVEAVQGNAPTGNLDSIAGLGSATQTGGVYKLTNALSYDRGSIKAKNTQTELDLAGFTLEFGSSTTGAAVDINYTGNTNYAIVADGADLCIKNGKIRVSDYYAQALRATNGGSITLENVKLELDCGWGVVASDTTIKTTSVNIIGCEIDYYGANQAVAANGNGSNYSISIVESDIHALNGLGVYFAGYGVYKISTSEITGKTSGMEIRAGTLEARNTVFKANATGYHYDPNPNGPTTTGAGISINEHTTNKALTVDLRDCTVSGVVGLTQHNVQGSSATPTTTIHGGMYTTTNTTDKTGDADAVRVEHGTLTIEDGVFGSSDGYGRAVQNNGATVEINGGTFTTASPGGGYEHYAINTQDGGTTTIKGGTVNGNINGAIGTKNSDGCTKETKTTITAVKVIMTGDSEQYNAIYAKGDGVTVDVNGGEFTRTYAGTGGMSMVRATSGATITLSDSTFTNSSGNLSYSDAASEVTIEDGVTFNGAIQA